MSVKACETPYLIKNGTKIWHQVLKSSVFPFLLNISIQLLNNSVLSFSYVANEKWVLQAVQFSTTKPWCGICKMWFGIILLRKERLSLKSTSSTWHHVYVSLSINSVFRNVQVIDSMSSNAAHYIMLASELCSGPCAREPSWCSEQELSLVRSQNSFFHFKYAWAWDGSIIPGFDSFFSVQWQTVLKGNRFEWKFFLMSWWPQQNFSCLRHGAISLYCIL